MKKLFIKFLKGFSVVWFVLAALFIMVNLGFVWYYQGFFKVCEIMSPFNIANFIVTLITLSPGIGAMFLADKLNK